MKALDIADCLIDEEYGDLTHSKEYTATVRLDGRVVHVYESWNGEHILSWWEETEGEMRMTDEWGFKPQNDVTFSYRDSCRWVFQGLR